MKTEVLGNGKIKLSGKIYEILNYINERDMKQGCDSKFKNDISRLNMDIKIIQYRAPPKKRKIFSNKI
jgi:hypothetical protein